MKKRDKLFLALILISLIFSVVTTFNRTIKYKNFEVINTEENEEESVGE